MILFYRDNRIVGSMDGDTPLPDSFFTRNRKTELPLFDDFVIVDTDMAKEDVTINYEIEKGDKEVTLKHKETKDKIKLKVKDGKGK